MNDILVTLEKLGFDSWFQDQIDPSKLNNFQIARVITVNKNSFIISNGVNEVFAELTGKYLFNSDSSLDFPTVGDWVYAQLFDEDSFAVIHDIFPENPYLKEKQQAKILNIS